MTDAHDPSAATPVPRAADSDRDATAELLRSAVADGRLELRELDDRLTATFAAKTHAELASVTADLPVPRSALTNPLNLRTKSGSVKRTGQWVVPSGIVAECTSGTIKLDFTEATCPHREVAIRAHASSGSVVLIVPHGWGVVMDDVTTTSGTAVSKVPSRPELDAPILRITGEVRSGTIKARYPRRSFWQWLLGRPA